MRAPLASDWEISEGAACPSVGKKAAPRRAAPKRKAAAKKKPAKKKKRK